MIGWNMQGTDGKDVGRINDLIIDTHSGPDRPSVFSLVPERHHDQALTIMQRIGTFVPRWAGATFVGMWVIGLLLFLVMWPFFGFADALVLGLIAGVLEAVPFIGPILSAAPAVLLAFGEGGRTPTWIACHGRLSTNEST